MLPRYKTILVLALAATLLTACSGAERVAKDPVAIHVKAQGSTSCNSDGGEVLIKVTPYGIDAFSRYHVVVSLFESGAIEQESSVVPNDNSRATLSFACKGKKESHYKVVVTGSGDHGLKGKGTDAFDVYGVPKSSR